MSAARIRNAGQRDDSADSQPEKSPPVGRTRNTRITVNINPSTEAALKLLMEQEQVTLTEAIRRMVGYGELIFRAIKLDGKDVLIRQGDETQQILLV